MQRIGNCRAILPPISKTFYTLLSNPRPKTMHTNIGGTYILKGMCNAI